MNNYAFTFKYKTNKNVKKILCYQSNHCKLSFFHFLLSLPLIQSTLFFTFFLFTLRFFFFTQFIQVKAELKMTEATEGKKYKRSL